MPRNSNIVSEANVSRYFSKHLIEPFGVIGIPAVLSEDSPHRMRYHKIMAEMKWWFNYYSTPNNGGGITTKDIAKMIKRAHALGASASGIEATDDGYKVAFALDDWFYIRSL